MPFTRINTDPDFVANEEGVFVLQRSFDVKPELLFNAFTDPEHLMKWWGPKGFNMVYCKLNIQPGGVLDYCLVSPQGQAVWGKFIYRKIPGLALVFTNTFVENSFRGWPKEILNKISFIAQGHRTTVKLSCEVIDEQKAFLTGYKQVKQDYNDALDKLENYLVGF